MRGKPLVFLLQEITAMLHDIMQGKIDEANVSLLVSLHQPLTKVVDSRELLEIILLGKFSLGENHSSIISELRISILLE